MKWIVFRSWLIILLVISISSLAQPALRQKPAESVAADQKISPVEAMQWGVEAYIFGYPLIMMEKTKSIMTNTIKPHDMKAPMGVFVHSRSFPDDSFNTVSAPNADTLYSIAWVDLTKGPYVLHVPNEQGRYYLMPMLNAWSEVFAVPGTRTTGTKAQDFVIVGPKWQGSLPKNMIQYKSSTNLVWIIGRTYCAGTPQDFQLVRALQDQYTLTPLSEYGKPTIMPPIGKFDPTINMRIPVRNQVNTMNAGIYFDMLAKSMKDNPPAPADRPILSKLTRLGIVPGQSFTFHKLDSAVIKELTQAPLIALKKIMDTSNKNIVIKNGWSFLGKTGNYGTDYLQRAYVAAIGLGANLSQDTVYLQTNIDNEGKFLSGANKYIIHFASEQLPPVKGFWSLTMYNNQYFFIPNALNRYALNPRANFKFNADGSLDLYIQKDSPGKDRESNWLPSPRGGFNLMLRLYWPKDAILNGTWEPPPVVRG